MKPAIRRRRLSTFFNLEKDPDAVGVPKIMDPADFPPTGLRPAGPIFNEDRAVAKTFQGWPLMLILAALTIGIGVAFEYFGVRFFAEYFARLFS